MVAVDDALSGDGVDTTVGQCGTHHGEVAGASRSGSTAACRVESPRTGSQVDPVVAFEQAGDALVAVVRLGRRAVAPRRRPKLAAGEAGEASRGSTCHFSVERSCPGRGSSRRSRPELTIGFVRPFRLTRLAASELNDQTRRVDAELLRARPRARSASQTSAKTNGFETLMIVNSDLGVADRVRRGPTCRRRRRRRGREPRERAPGRPAKPRPPSRRDAARRPRRRGTARLGSGQKPRGHEPGRPGVVRWIHDRVLPVEAPIVRRWRSPRAERAAPRGRAPCPHRRRRSSRRPPSRDTSASPIAARRARARARPQ